MKSLKIVSLVMVLIFTLFISGCFIKPYDKPEYREIETSQTAFLIPLDGDASKQMTFWHGSTSIPKRIWSKPALW